MLDFAVTLTLTLTLDPRPSKPSQFIRCLNYIIKQFGEIPSTGLLDITLTGLTNGRTTGRTHARTDNPKT